MVDTRRRQRLAPDPDHRRAVHRAAVMTKALATALCLPGIMLVAGCGHAQPASRTQLTVVALNGWVGRAVFHLSCQPAGGDVPSPAAACAALARQPQLITRPKPFVCWGSSWWDITVRGRLNGRPIQRSFSTCWTPQMATIKRLGIAHALVKHLVARRREEIVAGTTQLIPAGVLRSADLVTCNILGHRLSTPVPDTTGPDAKVSTGFGGGSYASVVLSVAHNVDGSVNASCHVGNS
jgi:hypothetical protein